MRVVIQIGYQKSMGYRKYGQTVKAYINDEECSWNDDCGEYITSKVESSKGILWYLWETDINEDDIIRIEAKTYMRNIGVDENRTFESIYYVEEEIPVREILMTGVGKRGYPLIKGRVLELGSVSEMDKRNQKLSDFLNDDKF